MPCCASAHTKWGPHTNTHLCRSLTCCPASQEFFGLQADPGSLKKRDSESDSLHKKQSGCRKRISPGLLVQLWRRDQTGKFHSARRSGSLRKQVIWTGFCNIRGHSQETRPHKPNLMPLILKERFHLVFHCAKITERYGPCVNAKSPTLQPRCVTHLDLSVVTVRRASLGRTSSPVLSLLVTFLR